MQAVTKERQKLFYINWHYLIKQGTMTGLSKFNYDKTSPKKFSHIVQLVHTH